MEVCGNTSDDAANLAMIVAGLPRKKHFRQRAHSNPLGDHSVEYPISPASMDWSKYYPKYFSTNSNKCDDKENMADLKQVEVLDIGCGYGGLLIALSAILPNSLILGMEIRVKVSEYVQERVDALRLTPTSKETDYHNIACIRTNAMKYLPNFFRRGQLQKAFILFPDPHFKKQKHKWRIVSSTLLAEYAYVLQIGALMYTISDVLEVHEWMVHHFNEHPLFERVPEELIKDDLCYQAMFVATEEGRKVARNKGDKYPAVFRRVSSD